MYKSLKEICEIAKQEKKEFYQIILEEDCHERKGYDGHRGAYRKIYAEVNVFYYQISN